MKQIKYWIPTILWMGIIFYFSSQQKLLVSDIYTVQFLFFKSLHVIEYAILSILFYWSFKNTIKHEAWKNFVDDLSPDSSGQNPKNPALVKKLNAGILLAPNIGRFADYVQTMIESEKPDRIVTELKQAGKVKLAVNFLKRGG